MPGQVTKLINDRLGATISHSETISANASTREYKRHFLTGDIEYESIITTRFGSGVITENADELYIGDIDSAIDRYREMTQILTKAQVNVPMILGSDIDKRLLILEDLGSFTLFDAIETIIDLDDPYSVEKLLQKALRLLIQIQIEGTTIIEADKYSLQELDEGLMRLEFHHLIENTNISKDIIADLKKEYEFVVKRLARIDRTLAHRDFHVWNILVNKGNLWIVDFQDAIMAAPHYDLVSILRDRDLDRYLPEGSEDRLIEFYLQQLYHARKQKTNRETFRQEYLLFSLQRDLKVIGRFFYLVNRGKQDFIEYLPHIIKRAFRTASLFPELTTLKDVIQTIQVPTLD